MSYKYIEIKDPLFTSYSRYYYLQGYWRLDLDQDLTLAECEMAKLPIYHYHWVTSEVNEERFYIARWIAAFWYEHRRIESGVADPNYILCLGELLKDEGMKAKWSLIASSSVTTINDIDYDVGAYMDELAKDMGYLEAK